MMSDPRPTCRSCGYPKLEQIIDLGETPLADRLLREDQLSTPEVTAPLELEYCPACSLVQISISVNPEILFGEEYLYYSSVSKSLQDHFAESAQYLAKKRKLNSNSLVV